MLRSSLSWLLLAALCFAPAPSCALTVLMVTENSGSLVSEESAHKTQFEAWGWTVTTVWDGDSQANINTAVAAVDVVFVPEAITSADLNTKLRTTTKGVVLQEPALDDDFGLSTTAAASVDATQINVTTSNHPITAGLSTGLNTVLTSTRAIPAMSATIASSFVTLANTPGGVANMGYIETGGTLANTLVSNSVASGRRVRLFVGSSAAPNPFIFSALNSTGQQLLEHALIWAAGKEDLVLHWRCNETSGTTAADASEYFNRGTYVGSPTLGFTSPRFRSVQFASSAQGITGTAALSLNGIGASNRDFSVAFWVRPSTPTSDYRLLFHKGANTADRVPGIWLNPTTNTIHYRLSTSFSTNEGSNSTTEMPSNRWSHVAVVKAGTAYRIYINGVLDVTSTIGGATTGNTGQVNIGRHPDGSYPNAGTAMDDIRVYNRALTAVEVDELYGLVGHWKLDETSGTTAADSSGMGHNGTVSGTATWTTGARANGFSVDYTNGEDYITIPNNSYLENVQENSYSIAAWFKPTNLPPGVNSDNTANYRIFGKAGYHIGIPYTNSGSFGLEHWLAAGPTWNGAGAYYPNPPGRFYHVASVVDRDTGTLSFYLDGVLAGTGTFTAGATAYEHGTAPWRIGISQPSATSWGHAANGVIDDVRLYNRTISADEVAELYGLVGHWKLDEASGTTAADSSGYGNTGTFTNGALPNTTAIYSKGATFDGVNDFVNVPNTVSTVNVRESLTVACWAKSDTSNWNATGCLVSKRDQFVLHPWSGGKYLDFYVYAPAWASAQVNLNSISNFSLQDWHHYAGVYNYNTGALQVYVDGILRATNNLTAGTAIGSDTGAITIGSDDGGSGYFDGDMDDVRIYNRALPASEIAELYGLKYWYKLDESSGSTASDSGPYTNNATVNAGSASWIAGRSGNALAFNGASSLISGLNIYPPTNGSVAFWMRVAGANATHGRIFGSAGDYEMRHVTAATSEGIPYGLVADLHIASNNFEFVTTTPVNSPNKWYYVVAVYNDTNDTYSLYIDGILHTSGVRTLTASPAAQLTIGNRTGATDYYNGDLEDLQIYQRELSAAEVLANYRLLKPPGIRLIKWIEVR